MSFEKGQMFVTSDPELGAIKCMVQEYDVVVDQRFYWQTTLDGGYLKAPTSFDKSIYLGDNLLNYDKFNVIFEDCNTGITRTSLEHGTIFSVYDNVSSLHNAELIGDAIIVGHDSMEAIILCDDSVYQPLDLTTDRDGRTIRHNLGTEFNKLAETVANAPDGTRDDIRNPGMSIWNEVYTLSGCDVAKTANLLLDALNFGIMNHTDVEYDDPVSAQRYTKLEFINAFRHLSR